MVRVRFRGEYTFTHNEHGPLDDGDIVEIGEYTLATLDHMFVPVDDDGSPSDSGDAVSASAETDAPESDTSRPDIPNDYDTLRQVAAEADLYGVNGRSGKAEIVDALEALSDDALRAALDAPDAESESESES